MADLVVGVFDPSKFGLQNWLGYKIQDTDNMGLRSYGRFLYVLANRNGEIGGVCPLFFDGAVCHFEELPKPDEIDKISVYYNKARDLKSFRQQKKFNSLTLFMFIKKFINKSIIKNLNILV